MQLLAKPNKHIKAILSPSTNTPVMGFWKDMSPFYCRASHMSVVATFDFTHTHTQARTHTRAHTHTYAFLQMLIPHRWHQWPWRWRGWWPYGPYVPPWLEKEGKKKTPHLSQICRPSTVRQTRSRLSGSVRRAWSHSHRRMEGSRTTCRQEVYAVKQPSTSFNHQFKKIPKLISEMQIGVVKPHSNGRRTWEGSRWSEPA